VRLHPPRGALVDYASRIPGPFAHTFCGSASLKGAECPRCERPLVQMLELDVRDPLSGLGALSLSRLPLLYCWGCRPERSSAFYQVSDRVTVIRRAAGKRKPRLPYRGYPTAFPAAPARLVVLPKEVAAHQAALNRALSRGRGARDAREPEGARRLPCHQVGGEPLLLAPWRTVTCPRCRKRIPFLATIADDNLDPRGFTGEPRSQVLFHLCRACRVVGAYRQTA
jgi:hypothetical protein